VHLPDPIADAIKGLSRRIETLERDAPVAADGEAAPSEAEAGSTLGGPNPAGG
jgi:hypothetical protein